MTTIDISTDEIVPEDYKGRDRTWWVKRILTDLFFLCREVLTFDKDIEYKDLNWVHRELCDFLNPLKNPHKQLLVLMARDMLKSSIGRAMIIQWFIQKRVLAVWGKEFIYSILDEETADIFIESVRGGQGAAFIYSGILDLAREHLEKIVMEITRNALLHSLLPNLLPESKEDFDLCRFDEGKVNLRGIEIHIGSPDRAVSGRHFELGMIDNLANETNTKTDFLTKSTNKSWQQLESVFIEEAREVIFETTWRRDDVSAIILDPETKFNYKILHRKPCYKFISNMGYYVFSCPAAEGDGEIGTPVFPEKIDEEYLRRKRAKQGPYIYSALYELQPIPDEEVIFRQEWWDVHYRELPDNFIRGIYVDAAGSTKPGSIYSGVTIAERDETGTIYIVSAYKRHVSPIQLADWVIELADICQDKGRPVTWIVVEWEKFGITIKEQIEAKRKDLIVIPGDLKGIPRKRRHDDLVPYFEQRMILSAEGLIEYEDELRTYYRGKEKNIDIIDTLWLIIRYGLTPEKRKVSKRPIISQLEKETAEFEEQAKQDSQDRFYEQKRIARRF